MHKDQGAKRYEGYIKERFGSLDVLAKRGGWRLARATKQRLEPKAVHPLRFEAAGLELTAWPGVFAAGKLDPGTKLLLEALDFSSLAGKRVLEALHGAPVFDHEVDVDVRGAGVPPVDGAAGDEEHRDPRPGDNQNGTDNKKRTRRAADKDPPWQGPQF
jgi:hypothetical protein